MEIITDDKTITFKFPRYQKRYNPYMEEESEQGLLGEYPTFTGLIVRHNKNGNDWDEIGFANTNDMSYADKPDQVGGFVVMWDGSEENFKKECKKLKMGIHEIEV